VNGGNKRFEQVVRINPLVSIDLIRPLPAGVLVRATEDARQKASIL